MATKRIKRPRDPVALAKLIGDIATGQVEDRLEDERDARAVERPTAGRGGNRLPRSPVENAYSVAWAFGCIIPERRAPDDEPNAPGVVALPAAHHVGQLPEQHVRIGL